MWLLIHASSPGLHAHEMKERSMKMKRRMSHKKSHMCPLKQELIIYEMWLCPQGHFERCFGFTIKLSKIRSHQIPWFNLAHYGLVTSYGDRSGSTLAQVMAWCLTAPSHYLNQCWPLSYHKNYVAFLPWAISYELLMNQINEVSLKLTLLKITPITHRDQWVKTI